MNDSEELADALRSIMALIEDGDLVRNISEDGDVQAFFRQSCRIVTALKKAQIALGRDCLTIPAPSPA